VFGLYGEVWLDGRTNETDVAGYEPAMPTFLSDRRDMLRERLQIASRLIRKSKRHRSCIQTDYMAYDFAIKNKSLK
jgi:hypothetical protein